MYASPVLYPASLLPARYRLVLAVNPLVSVVEGFRSVLLGTGPVPWSLIGLSVLTSTALFLSGLVYFRHTERIFADVA
jgi:lipopolysaccharide transport system permease protein